MEHRATHSRQFQREGAAAFSKSWSDLMYRIASRNEVLTKAKQA